MNNRIVINLDQITPMLHFQSDQYGACLRASEVKPKMDSFILQWLDRQGVKVENLPEGWAVTDDQGWTALRYRMRFEANGKNTYPQDKDAHSLYFAGLMDGSNAKCVYYPDGMRMTVVVLVSSVLPKQVTLPDGFKTNELGDIVEHLAPAFFSLHCFGTRSNKGFGSFEVRNQVVPVDLLDELKPDHITSLYMMQSSRADNDDYDYEAMFDDILVLSTMMKGGINLAGFGPYRNHPVYFKGQIQADTAQKSTGTEKAFIKQRVFTDDDRRWYNDEICRDPSRRHQVYSNYQFSRAMLGLTDGYAYGVGRRQRVFSVSSLQPEIERFHNPVHFKPFPGGFYILVNRIPDAMYEAKFEIRSPSQGRGPGKSESPHVIQTPGKEDFNLDKFVREVLLPLKEGSSFPASWDDLISATDESHRKPKSVKLRFCDTLDNLYLTYGGAT